MHMGPMHALVEGLLRRHGHATTRDATLEGRSGMVYEVPILAERHGANVLVEVKGPGEPADAAAVTDLAHVAHDAGADLALLVHVEDLAPGARAANDGSVVFWSAAQLARLVGEAAVADATGRMPAPLPLDPNPPELASAPAPRSLDDLLPAAFADGGPANAAPADTPLTGPWLADAPPADATGPDMWPADTAPDGKEDGADAFELLSSSLGAARETTGTTADLQEPAPAWPTAANLGTDAGADVPLADIDAAASLGPPLTFAEPEARAEVPRALRSRPLIQPALALDVAVLRSRDRVYGVKRAELLLRPCHVFSYEVDVLADGSLRYETICGHALVDATRPRVEAAGPLRYAAAAPDGTYTVDERGVRIDADKAARLAQDWVAAQHARTVEVRATDDEESFAYTEKKHVAPRRENIRVAFVATVNRPAWRLFGANGHVDVDALDGSPVDENLRNPHPDIIMVD